MHDLPRRAHIRRDDTALHIDVPIDAHDYTVRTRHQFDEISTNDPNLRKVGCAHETSVNVRVGIHKERNMDVSEGNEALIRMECMDTDPHLDASCSSDAPKNEESSACSTGRTI